MTQRPTDSFPSSTPVPVAPLSILAAAGLAWSSLALSGLALSGLASSAMAQGDPLAEPFPVVLGLETLDGAIGFGVPGEVERFQLGQSVGSAGDLNGDGIGDAVFGQRESSSLLGTTYVVFGRRGEAFPATLDPATLDGANGFRIDGGGGVAAAAGDVNGDGLDDLIIGSPFDTVDRRSFAGRSFVIFGRDAAGAFPASLDARALEPHEGFSIRGGSTLLRSGWAVAGAGDVNGDGLADVVIGAPGYGSGGDAGSAYVVFGRQGPGAFPGPIDLAALDGREGFRMSGVEAEGRAGAAVAGAGDFNGDGLGDLIIGEPNSRGGLAHVVFGRDAFPATIDLARPVGQGVIRLSDAGGWAGWSVAAAGDINHDGVGDVVVGAPRSSPAGRVGSGASYVVFGRAAPVGAFPPVIDLRALDGGDGLALLGVQGAFPFEEPGDRSGMGVAGPGDVNGDGIDDLLIGAPYGDRGRYHQGEVYVVYGRDGASNPFPPSFHLVALDGTTGVTIRGAAHFNAIGGAVAGAGDVNGDGAPDIIIGAPMGGRFDLPDAGSVHVVFGRRPAGPCRADLDGDGALTIFDFLAFLNAFDAMDPIADFDGDGDLTLLDWLAFQNAFDAGCP